MQIDAHTHRRTQTRTRNSKRYAIHSEEITRRDGQAARAAAYPELSKLMAELSKTRKDLKAVKDVLAKEKLNPVKPVDAEPGWFFARTRRTC